MWSTAGWAPVPDGAPPRSLPARTPILFALGDHAVNLALSSLLFVFPNFLTDVAGLRPALAGLVPMIGRVVDALTDPAMGRLSDHTSWRAGRRRPYFLLGMLPFGVTFAALWWPLPGASDNGRFAYYSAAYIGFSLAVTMIAVPYAALIPEIAPGYHERTRLNAWRASFAIGGALLAASVFRPLAEALGGGPGGFQKAGILAGIWVSWPWLLVYFGTFERPGYQRRQAEGLFESLTSVSRHGSFRVLVGIMLTSRIAIDLTGTMFIFWFRYWIGRPGDFPITMALFLGSAATLGFPLWNRVGRYLDKRTVFLFGASSWVAAQAFIFFATPEWPRTLIFVFAAFAGIGYAAADMIPWSMLGEVVDEDEVQSGFRREGIYAGSFTFLRKLGGASAVALALWALDLSGYVQNQAQAEGTLWTIRVLTAALPGLFVLLAGVVALRYPLSQKRHEEILAVLAERRAAARGAS